MGGRWRGDWLKFPYTPWAGIGRITTRGAVETMVRVRHEVVDVAVMPLENGHYLLFCQQYPTGACVAGNGGVRSPRDNVTTSHGMAAGA